MYNPFSLQGKNILVTGASSGIGKAVAIECSKSGANLFITGRDKNKLSETYLQLEGKNHVMVSADLTNSDDIDTLIKDISTLDGLVHCAGMIMNVPFQFATRDNFDKILSVNFYAPVEISRKLFKSKLISKNASIVFISSISGVLCSAVASSIYSASKGAINGLIKGMALDMAKNGIRVNSINPGVIETNIFDSGAITVEQLQEDKKRYPLKRFGKPNEVAYAAIYLLSDASSWVTGSNLLIDGGFTLL